MPVVKGCKGSGVRVTGCKWREMACPECGQEFFPTYDTGRWKVPKHNEPEVKL